MTKYKLIAPRKFGDMPKDYQFIVSSQSIGSPNAQDVEKEIARLGFNKDAQSYRSSGNWIIEKIK